MITFEMDAIFLIFEISEWKKSQFVVNERKFYCDRQEKLIMNKKVR